MPMGRGVCRAFAGESPTTSRGASDLGAPESLTLASIAAPPLPEPPLPAEPPPPLVAPPALLLPLAPALPLVVLEEVLAPVMVAPVLPLAPAVVLPVDAPLAGGLSLELQPRKMNIAKQTVAKQTQSPRMTGL
jgi:hypothetical protein